MLRSLYSGVSGLQNHQTRMDVIGNNISNVNTTGFKKSRVTFQDILSQTTSGAAKPSETRGGVNAKQVGLGMSVAAIETLMTQGSMQTTGKNTDIAITGEGFFVVQEGDQTFHTRNGNFMLDRDGTLVNSNGMKVQGWTSELYPTGEYMIDTAAPVGDLKIEPGQKVEAKETAGVKFRSNLDANSAILPETASAAENMLATHGTSIDIFDPYGNNIRLSSNFKKNELNSWQMSLAMTNEDGTVLENVQVSINGAKLDTNNVLDLSFNTNGTLAGATEAAGAAGDTLQEGQLVATVTYDHPDGTQQSFNLELGEVGSVKNSITQFASRFTTEAYFQDGNTMGYMESFNIDDTGVITGVMDNGVRRPLGQLAMSSFTNAAGLEKVGNSLYMSSNNSGDAMIGESGLMGRGSLFVGALEMSNVDLAESFTDMIVTERGFQSNSRVITTSDNMLQEILSLKR
ncbi:MAG: flagellar hook protein FlgE [Spirochaetota bacterium]|nr:flagellar hook protein FlgE [Spirochaetota bacterium]